LGSTKRTPRDGKDTAATKEKKRSLSPKRMKRRNTISHGYQLSGFARFNAVSV